MQSLPVLLALCAIFAGQVAYAEQTVCYFGSWSTYRPPTGTFNIEDIDPFLCTTVIYGFAGVNNNDWTIRVLDPWNDLCANEDPSGGKCGYNRFTALKQQNPSLITTLAVGGWNEGSAGFSAMAADPAKRNSFIQSTVTLLNAHGFDGLDMDWEYPTQRGGAPEDRANFVTLLGELRAAFDANSPRLTLTAALAAGKDTIDPSYDVAGFAGFLDAFHIMTYDFHGSWETETMHQSPLCGGPNDSGRNIYFRDDFAVEYWVQLGAPRNKIIMGVPLYARCWTVNDLSNNGLYAPANQPSPSGPYTQTAGTLANNEICELYSSCPVVQDVSLNEPYFFCPTTGVWCGFEDEASAYKKARWAKNHGLGGVLIWEIDFSDFIPVCASIKFPLIHQINDALAQAPDAVPFECGPMPPF